MSFVSYTFILSVLGWLSGTVMQVYMGYSTDEGYVRSSKTYVCGKTIRNTKKVGVNIGFNIRADVTQATGV